jgi:hypothetical protein
MLKPFLACALAVASAFPRTTHAAAVTPNPGLKYYYAAPAAPVVDRDADVVVYGGTSGGVAAAVQAARHGKSVVLVVFGRHLGGMTSGGLTETDGVNFSQHGGITREFFTVTGTSFFKPAKAEATFEALVADPVPGQTGDAPIPVYYEQRLDHVEKVGARITALHMENGSVFRGKMFIDCTYEGDLMAQAGVPYTWGRESSAHYGESLAGRRASVALPGVNPYNTSGVTNSGLIPTLVNESEGTVGQADQHVQAYNFRMYTVQSTNPANLRPLFAPATYDANIFEILYRYHRSGGNTSMQIGNDINNHEMFDPGCSTDHIGGNRWPDGSGGWIPWCEADYATRELMYQDHVAWQLGMLWYIKTDARYHALTNDLAISSTIRSNIASLITKVSQLGLPTNEYPETDGWPHELYVREARRMVSDFVLTQAHHDGTAPVVDPVGLANYAIDAHYSFRFPGNSGGTRVESGTFGATANPWPISYRAIIPPASAAENLLVPWAISASHVAFCSMRMEPVFMVLSQSAATAAALAIDRGESVQALPYPLLRTHLVAGGQIPGDDPSTDVNEVIVDNQATNSVQLNGAWTVSTTTSGYYGPDYIHDGNPLTKGTLSVRYTPNLPTSGAYTVFARWTAHTNRSTVVPIDIVHLGGTNSVVINQTTNGGFWYELGTFTFDAGTQGWVRVRNDGATGYVIADAIRFLPTGSVDRAREVEVVAVDPHADEADNSPGRFRFVREQEDSGTAITLQLRVDGTALSGTHYLALPTNVVMGVGEYTKELSVKPVTNLLAEGSRTIQVNLLAHADYTVGAQSNAVILLRDRPYDNWRYTHFSGVGLENAPDSGPTANPDNDGNVNLLEFLMGSDPRDNSSSSGAVLRVEGTNTVYEYLHRGEANTLQAEAQISEDLMSSTWQASVVGFVTTDYQPATGDRLQRMVLPIGNTTNRFFRLQVW